MTVLWHAIQAATIETLGVVLIVLILFGIPAWTLAGKGDSPIRLERVTNWFPSLHHGEHDESKVTQIDTTIRHRYAQQRLSNYSRRFCESAAEQVDRLIDQTFHVQPHPAAR